MGQCLARIRRSQLAAGLVTRHEPRLCWAVYMILEILPPNSHSSVGEFNAEHPMFRYDVPKVPANVSRRMAAAKNIIVLGMGGSVLPLKAFTDTAGLKKSVHFLDTVDPQAWTEMQQLPDPLYCLVSKSGETLEIKVFLARLISEGLLKEKALIVTDAEKGFLRQFVTEQRLDMTLEVPSSIGGRFTNFSIFNRAVLERFGIQFENMLQTARTKIAELRKNPQILEELFLQLFGKRQKQPHSLILWAYGDRLYGLAKWIQQAIAESLGKRSTTRGERCGILPVVLSGPQDQHSMLQLFIDGPQTNVFWFLLPKAEKPADLDPPLKDPLSAPLSELSGVRGSDILGVLGEATFRTFKERLANPETLQVVSRFEIGRDMKDISEFVAVVQALVEFAGKRLGINAFDQPGVERGKEIARELLKKGSGK